MPGRTPAAYRRAGGDVRPHRQVRRGVADHDRLAGGAGGRVDARQPVPRHGQQAERVGVAEVGLDREREARAGRPVRGSRTGAPRRRRSGRGCAAPCRKRAPGWRPGGWFATRSARRGTVIGIMAGRPCGTGRGTPPPRRPARRPEHRTGRTVPACAIWRAVATRAVPPRHRLQEGDGAGLRHGALALAVAGVGEGAVGQGEDEAAVADAVAVQHLRPDRHRQPRLPRPDSLPA